LVLLNINTLEVNFALDATRLAALLVRQVQSELVSPALTKDDRSPVTVADFASQALVAYLLQEAFPDDLLVAEEDSALLRNSEEGNSGVPAILQRVTYFVQQFQPQASPEEICDWIDRGKASPARRFWTLDPIDGTKGFLRGDQYAVALALVEAGQVILGVLGCPELDDGYRPGHDGPGSLVVAAQNQGAWVTSLESPGEFERLRVSRREDPSLARLLRSFESAHTNVDQIESFIQTLCIEVGSTRMDSQAKYALLASGKADLMLRLLSPHLPYYREKIWDQAAGSLILEQAGGKVTDLDGKPLDFTTGRALLNNRGVVASNGKLHAAALDALRAIHA
jgi:3'(2'), 5'-bisphosphate nucleotidase